MPSIFVTLRDGQEEMIEAENDLSLMENVRNAGIAELTAICGGCCSCATCHIYLSDGPEDMLPPINADEDDLLDSSNHRTAQSRLSCQIKMRDALDGIRITIAPED